jgi:hypothetical protein
VITGKASWEDARELIEKETGPIRAVTELSEGRNSEISVIVRTNGDATFVKGRRAGHPQAWTQERERIINPLVRHISPALKWSSVNGDWDLLGFEYMPGFHADYSPGSPDIPKVMRTLLQLQEIACPDIDVKRADQRWASYTGAPELLGAPAFCTPTGAPATSWSTHVRTSWTGRGLPGARHGSTRPAWPSG